MGVSALETPPGPTAPTAPIALAALTAPTAPAASNSRRDSHQQTYSYQSQVRETYSYQSQARVDRDSRDNCSPGAREHAGRKGRRETIEPTETTVAATGTNEDTEIKARPETTKTTEKTAVSYTHLTLPTKAKL